MTAASRAVIAAVTLVVSCGRGDRSRLTVEDAAPVRGDQAAAKSVREYFAVVVPEREVFLRAPSQATIESIRIERGASTRALEVVAVLGGPALTRQLEAAQASAKGARARLAAAQELQASRAVRLRSLRRAGAGVVSGFEIESAEAALAEATSGRAERKAELDSAEAALKEAQAVADNAEIKSPIAGRVAELNVTVGQEVDRGDPIARIVADEALKVRFAVPADDQPPAVDARIWFRVGNVAAPGRVTQVQPEADPRTGIRIVDARIDRAQVLELGARGSVSLTQAPSHD